MGVAKIGLYNGEPAIKERIGNSGLKAVSQTLIVMLSLYLLFGALIFIFQRNLLYFADETVPAPADYGLADVESIRFPTDDRLKIFAWWRPPVSEYAPVLVYFHGNAGHLGHRAEKVAPFLRKGYGLLLVTYRYNAGTGGTPNENSLYRDGDAAVQYLQQRGIRTDRLVLYGESLGTALAVNSAKNFPVACLVLEAPFSSMADLAQHHYPYLPAKWLIRDRFQSDLHIQNVNVPMLFVHGRQDQIVPLKFAQKLVEFIETACPRNR